MLPNINFIGIPFSLGRLHWPLVTVDLSTSSVEEEDDEELSIAAVTCAILVALQAQAIQAQAYPLLL
jgi:hypothetical protein